MIPEKIRFCCCWKFSEFIKFIFEFHRNESIGSKEPKTVTNSTCVTVNTLFHWSHRNSKCDLYQLIAFKHNSNSISLRKSIKSNKIQSSRDWLFSLCAFFISIVCTQTTHTPTAFPFLCSGTGKSAQIHCTLHLRDSVNNYNVHTVRIDRETQSELNSPSINMN